MKGTLASHPLETEVSLEENTTLPIYTVTPPQALTSTPKGLKNKEEFLGRNISYFLLMEKLNNIEHYPLLDFIPKLFCEYVLVFPWVTEYLHMKNFMPTMLIHILFHI